MVTDGTTKNIQLYVYTTHLPKNAVPKNPRMSGHTSSGVRVAAFKIRVLERAEWEKP